MTETSRADLLSSSVDRIRAAQRQLHRAETVDELLGHEGAGSRAYFHAFPVLLRNPQFNFPGRARRPPRDALNSMLSFGYTLLMGDLVSASFIVGLDPHIGFLHATKYSKPALALDLVEEYRPLFVDRMVTAAINRRVFAPDDFLTDPVSGSVRFKEESLKRFLVLYAETKASTFEHPVLKRSMSYQESFEIQTRLFAKYLSGEVDTYHPLRFR